jgi:hypothetical protein
LLAAAVSAQATVGLGSAGSLTFKGFLSFTAFAQDQNFAFGNGQNASFRWGIDRRLLVGGGDVRNTRLTMLLTGPKVVEEGGRNTRDRLFGETTEQRLQRPAAAPGCASPSRFTNGSTTIRMGQRWSPCSATRRPPPTFLLGYGSAGDIGWRFPASSSTEAHTKDAVVNATQAAVLPNLEQPDCGRRPPASTPSLPATLVARASCVNVEQARQRGHLDLFCRPHRPEGPLGAGVRTERQARSRGDRGRSRSARS